MGTPNQLVELRDQTLVVHHQGLLYVQGKGGWGCILIELEPGLGSSDESKQCAQSPLMKQDVPGKVSIPECLKTQLDMMMKLLVGKSVSDG